jgi:hypothetical protein
MNQLIFLMKFGFSELETEFIRSHTKINVTENKVHPAATLWTNEAVEYVTESERYLFMMLNDFGFRYAKPEYH